MASSPAKISVRIGGRELELSAVADPVRQVGGLLRACADASDVTVSIELPDDHGTLLIAVEAGSALVGLAAPDGIYQYVGDDTAQGTHQFIIGHQPTSIDTRYVLPVDAAIEALTSWLAGSAPPAGPGWERRCP
jgi:hypothetical protein